jgi:DNA mismatch repair protein MutS
MADSASAAPQNVAMTPFMAQFFAAKDKHPDALVFFRMGDFYELFFEDAEKAAAALDITLTKRGQHGGDPIPMAGVPWHQAEGYLQRLIRQGFRVAVVEQLEDPAEAKKRGSKSIVKRDVVRVVTPARRDRCRGRGVRGGPRGAAPACGCARRLAPGRGAGGRR